jgi:hypothetical protein
MSKTSKTWWNVVIDVTMPFDTEEEARAFLDGDRVLEGAAELAHGLTRDCRETVGATIWKAERIEAQLGS